MLAVRSPLRVSFFGGGSDIPEIYQKIGGCVFSVAIQKYVYVFMNSKWPNVDDTVTAKYSIIEEVPHPRYLQHPIMRTVLTKNRVTGVDISVLSDIPGGTGLGSSSAFTVGFVLLTNTFLGKSFLSKSELADKACSIEIDELNEPIGKQDAFASTFGGLKKYEFDEKGRVSVSDSEMKEKSFLSLQKCIFLVRVGGFRKTSDLLMQQINELNEQSTQIEIYQKIAQQARWASHLKEFNPYEFGEALSLAWEYKKSLSSRISNDMVGGLIAKGMNSGASGAKLLGAGGSGFVLFIVPEENQEKFTECMKSMKVINPLFDIDGARLVYS
jgi:D-glycero-alpha-D-manno-heptose-7-phosphate kinase